MIKAVLLDLGEVVVGLDFPRAYRAATKLTDYTAEEIPKLISASGLARVYEHGQMSSETFYQKLSVALDLSGGFDEFRRIWENMFDPEPLISDLFLEGLARRTTLLLLSNTNELHFNSVRRRYPLLRHFHDSVSFLRGWVYEAGGGHLPRGHPKSGVPAQRMLLHRRQGRQCRSRPSTRYGRHGFFATRRRSRANCGREVWNGTSQTRLGRRISAKGTPVSAPGPNGPPKGCTQQLFSASWSRQSGLRSVAQCPPAPPSRRASSSRNVGCPSLNGWREAMVGMAFRKGSGA